MRNCNDCKKTGASCCLCSDVTHNNFEPCEGNGIKSMEFERRIQCNWCESVFDEKYIKLKDEDIECCPVCGDSGYLMDVHEMERETKHDT